MSVESFSEAEAGHLFEELFLHYRKRRILEKEMLDFFKSSHAGLGLSRLCQNFIHISSQIQDLPK